MRQRQKPLVRCNLSRYMASTCACVCVCLSADGRNLDSYSPDGYFYCVPRIATRERFAHLNTERMKTRHTHAHRTRHAAIFQDRNLHKFNVAPPIFTAKPHTEHYVHRIRFQCSTMTAQLINFPPSAGVFCSQQKFYFVFFIHFN